MKLNNTWHEILLHGPQVTLSRNLYNAPYLENVKKPVVDTLHNGTNTINNLNNLRWMTVSELECQKWTSLIKWFHKPQAGQTSTLRPHEAVQTLLQELEVWAGSGLETAETESPPLELRTFRPGREFRTWQASNKDNKPKRDAPQHGMEEKPRKVKPTPRGDREIRTPCWRASAKFTACVLLSSLEAILCLWNRKKEAAKSAL